jgi:hypothetical protein
MIVSVLIIDVDQAVIDTDILDTKGKTGASTTTNELDVNIGSPQFCAYAFSRSHTLRGNEVNVGAQFSDDSQLMIGTDVAGSCLSNFTSDLGNETRQLVYT